ncbi:hypothetical protein CP556_25045 [Natrinema sp. CBA1119]|uniref:hypothetical protein n=1 Tax=Natrinema sp. CBA1119 TaxID=1608465 RepID=UPI000BFA4256|nr:hypothetical protein [Natrinema sp. CBA1119]PGF13798.1 hypothetical protein CP556_25045 [Natrinema sp. CBA1119]
MNTIDETPIEGNDSTGTGEEGANKMSERTNWDESVDEAIKQLIDDDTEAFTLVTVEDQDSHLVKATETPVQELLPIYLLVEKIRMMAVEAGEPLSPQEILFGAMSVAEERGYLEDDFDSDILD